MTLLMNFEPRSATPTTLPAPEVGTEVSTAGAPTLSPDRALLAQYAQHPRQSDHAFTALVQRHGGMVYHSCMRILGDAALAEDASQAAFLVLAQRARHLHGEVGGFLHGVAVKIARRALGAERLRKVREWQAAEQRETAVACQPGHQKHSAPGAVAWAEIEPVLDEAIEQLPARQKEALVLYYLEGRTQADVAKRMGLERGTVAKQVQRALEKLRQLLTRRGFDCGLRQPTASSSCQSQATTIKLQAAFLVVKLSELQIESDCPAFLVQAAGNIASAGGSQSMVGLAQTVVQMGKGAMSMIYWEQIRSAITLVAAATIMSVSVVVAVERISPGDLPPPPVVAPGEKPADLPKPVAEEIPTPDNGDQALRKQLDTTISLNHTNEKVLTILELIRDQGKLNMAFDYLAVEHLEEPVSLDIKNLSLENALNLTLQMTSLEYTTERGVVVIRVKGETRDRRIDAARLQEQSPGAKHTEADQKTLAALAKKPPQTYPTTATLEMVLAGIASYSEIPFTIPKIDSLTFADQAQHEIRFESGANSLDTPVVLDTGHPTQWELLADALKSQNLCWRLEDGSIVITKRGIMSMEGCLRRNAIHEADEIVKRNLLKRVSLDIPSGRPLKDAIDLIAKECDVSILYESTETRDSLTDEGRHSRIRTVFSDLPGRDALEFILRGWSSSYRVEFGAIVIYTNPK